MQAARGAGVEGVLVRTGRGDAHAHQVAADLELRATPIVEDFTAAVDLVCERHASGSGPDL
jgi:D-glycero-D-manno-heptose 1,7-bisphosphate phosphatase